MVDEDYPLEKKLIERILNGLLVEPFEVNIFKDESHYMFNIVSDEFQQLMGKKRKLVDALEHLLHKSKSKTNRGKGKLTLLVDCNSVRANRKQSLIKLANDMGSRVREKGQPIVIDNRSAYERRVIHMALSKETDIFTKSVGNGVHRKLMILPNRDQA